MVILIGLIVIFVLVFLLGHYLGKHHGESLAIKFTSGVFAISFILALLPLLSLYKGIDEDMNLRASWERVNGIQGPVSDMHYKPNIGLYAIMDNKVIKITNEIPLCSDNRQSYINPTDIEITSNPRVNIPIPSNSVKQQISFNLIHPTGEDSYGSSSFAIYDNGELWCTEKFEGGGMADGMYLAGLLIAILMLSSFAFVSSFIFLSIVVIIILKIIQHNNTSLYQKIIN